MSFRGVLESTLVSVLCQHVYKNTLDIWSLEGHFGDFSRSCWCLWESLWVHAGPWGPKEAQGSPKSDFGHILGSFWEPSGSTFEVILAFLFRNRRDYVDFLVPFVRSRKKEQKRSSPGGGHAIRSRRRMFRESRPSSRRLHFGLHFWSILGGQVGTILLWGRPEMQTTYPEARVNFEYVSKQDESRIRVQRDRVPPPQDQKIQAMTEPSQQDQQGQVQGTKLTRLMTPDGVGGFRPCVRWVREAGRF